MFFFFFNRHSKTYFLVFKQFFRSFALSSVGISVVEIMLRIYSFFSYQQWTTHELKAFIGGFSPLVFIRGRIFFAGASGHEENLYYYWKFVVLLIIITHILRKTTPKNLQHT